MYVQQFSPLIPDVYHFWFPSNKTYSFKAPTITFFPFICPGFIPANRSKRRPSYASCPAPDPLAPCQWCSGHVRSYWRHLPSHWSAVQGETVADTVPYGRRLKSIKKKKKKMLYDGQSCVVFSWQSYSYSVWVSQNYFDLREYILIKSNFLITQLKYSHFLTPVQYSVRNSNKDSDSKSLAGMITLWY